MKTDRSNNNLVALFIVITLIFIQTTSIAQNKDTKDYLHPIEMEDSIFAGEGIDWIISNSENKQFILFGEQHGIKNLGNFVGYIYQSLMEKGFANLGLEMDGWTTEQLQKLGVEAFLSKYPNSAAFGYDGELRMIQKVIDTQKLKKRNIWGVDQMITAVHPFQRLAELSNNSSAARLSRGAFLKASLKMGEYLREEHFKDLEALKESFANNDNAEIQQIFDELKISMEIYTKWRAGQRGEISKRRSPEIRENMMKDNFDSFIERGNNGQQLNKAIFKMGGAHLMYGIGPNGILTLGDHINKHAEKNGLSTLSLSIRNFYPELALIYPEDFNGSDMLLVENKKLLEKIEQENFEVPNFEENERSIKGFDAIIYIKDAQLSGKNILSGYKQQFRSNLINRLLPIAVLLLICLTSIFTFAFMLIKRKEKYPKAPIVFSLISSLILCSLIIFQLLTIRNIIPHSAAIMPADISLLIFIMLFILGGFFIFSAFNNFVKKWYAASFRIYYLITAFCFTGLTLFCYYWNIGGMLINN